jgi:hypothetical protein
MENPRLTIRNNQLMISGDTEVKTFILESLLLLSFIIAFGWLMKYSYNTYEHNHDPKFHHFYQAFSLAAFITLGYAIVSLYPLPTFKKNIMMREVYEIKIRKKSNQKWMLTFFLSNGFVRKALLSNKNAQEVLTRLMSEHPEFFRRQKPEWVEREITM